MRPAQPQLFHQLGRPDLCPSLIVHDCPTYQIPLVLEAVTRKLLLGLYVALLGSFR